MCVQMYCNHIPNNLIVSEYNDEIIYINNYYHTDHLPDVYFEYFQILDYMKLHNDNTENIRYIVGIFISIFAIYHLTIEIIRSIRVS